MLHLIQVRNPLLPSESKFTQELDHAPGETLDRTLVRSYMTVDGAVVSLNGRILPPEHLALTIPRDGDFIVVSPSIYGGGVWRILASVAIMAASVAVGIVSAGAGFALLGLSTSATSALLAGAVAVTGNLLVSAFLRDTPSQKSQTPSYAFDGPHSLAQSGTVIPKGYGNFLSGGNIISSFVDIEGENQYLNALVCYGFGPARSLTGIEINGKDIQTYLNCEYDIRLGSNTQAPIPRFNRIVNGYPQDTQCLAGSPVVVPGTGDLTESLQVDIQFPDGIFYTHKDGSLGHEHITYLVEYSVSGLNEWKPVLQPYTTHDIVVYNSDGTVNASATPYWVVVPNDQPAGLGLVYSTDTDVGAHYVGEPWNETETVTTYAADDTESTASQTFSGTWQKCDPTMNQVAVDSWSAGYIYYVNIVSQTLYNRTSIYGLAPNKYDVRITKYGSSNVGTIISPGDNFIPGVGQDMWVHSVNEITYQDLAYPNMILLGVRAQATGQLAGGNINITALVEYGLRSLDNNLLPAELQIYEENNPACIAADMMLDPLYGGGQFPGIAPANIERYIDEWLSWAGLNDTLVPDGNGDSIRLHVFNGIFDQEQNLWQALTVVSQMSRAAILSLGRDYGVFVDQEDTPVQMFTMGNIIQDSFQETWLALDDRANQVEVQFADSTRYYKQDNPVVYMSAADQDAGVAIKNVRVSGTGITIPAQAWHLAHFKGLNNDLLLRTGQFKCDVTAIACRPGDLVLLQHDVPQWGWGGRLLPGSSAGIFNADRHDIPFVAGTSYNCIVIHPFLQRYATYITGVSGNLLGVPGYDGESRVTRAIFCALGSPIRCLLLNETFAGLFTAWTVTPRTGDSLLADLSQAFYLVNSTWIHTPFTFLSQTVPSSLVTVGQSLILSAYLQAYGLTGSPIGAVVITVTMVGPNVISSAALFIKAASTTEARVSTPPIAVPSGTTSVLVTIGLAASHNDEVRHPDYFNGILSIPPGSTIVASKIQLEIVASGITAPTPWEANGVVTDCEIQGYYAGQIEIIPPPGFTPVSGTTVGLFDTDVMETRAVTAVTNLFDSTTNLNSTTITLASPLSAVPRDYCAYLYGPAGNEAKQVRVTAIRKASEFRSTIEWIEYNSGVYAIGTPVVGETSAVVNTNPGVTDLEGINSFSVGTITESYVAYISLTWKNGPNTAGVSIYGTVSGNPTIRLLVRLTAAEQAWKFESGPGETWTMTVVGFDVDGYYAEYSTAPSVSVTTRSVPANLLIGSTFATGFAYWNISGIVNGNYAYVTSADNGYATYLVPTGRDISASQPILNQIVPADVGWVPGGNLILSGYLAAYDLTVYGSARATLTLMFINASNALISSATASVPFITVGALPSSPSFTRVNTGVVAVPSGTVLVKVKVSIEAPSSGTFYIIPGSMLAVGSILLEVPEAGQTVPSPWADIDVTTRLVNLITGASTSLRTQASTLKTYVGDFTTSYFYAAGVLDLQVSSSGLAIVWPDGSYTYLEDNTFGWTAPSGAAVGTQYWVFLYYDVVSGLMGAATVTTPVNTPTNPPTLSATYDANADAACSSDRRVSLAPGGITLTVPSTAGSGFARGNMLPQGGVGIAPRPSLPA